MFLCESFRMMYSRSLYIASEIYFLLLSSNIWNFTWTHRHSLLSTRYDLFHGVGFLFLLSFSRGFIVSVFLFHDVSKIIFFIVFIFFINFSMNVWISSLIRLFYASSALSFGIAHRRGVKILYSLIRLVGGQIGNRVCRLRYLACSLRLALRRPPKIM